MAASTSNQNRQVVSDEAAEGILLGFYEAKLAQHRSETQGWWDTPRGLAAERTYGFLMMALEAMGYDLSDDTHYRAWLNEKEN